MNIDIETNNKETFKNMATIIAFGIQPDQVESGMGGTILKLTETAHQVTIVDLTNGEQIKNNQTEHRKKEAIKASRILGIDERITMDYLYSEFNNTFEIREEVSDILTHISADILFVPYPIKNQPEIQFVADICKTSLNNLCKKNPHFLRMKIFYYFATPHNYFKKPTFIVDISKEIEMKVEALKCYETQFGKNINDSRLFDNTLNLNRYYGMLIGKNFGESFVSTDPLAIQNLDFLI